MPLLISATLGFQTGPAEIRISWDVVWFMTIFVALILLAVLVNILAQTARKLRQTLSHMDTFFEDTEEVIRNLKSITYKLNLQLDDTAVISSNLRKSVEDVHRTLGLVGRLSGQPWSSMLSLAAPLFWFIRHKRKKKARS